MKSSTLKITLIVAIAFGVYYILDEQYFRIFRSWLHEDVIHQYGISHNIAYLVSGIPIFLGTILMHRESKFFKSLGLNGSLIKAIKLSLICTSPMLLGYLIVFDLNRELTLNTFLISGVAAAFFEEIYFRAFLFGQVFRYTRFGFIPSIFFGAIIFALSHLYQSSDPATIFGIFITTLLGAILFAWLYVEWKFSIWIPILLHFFMNVIWMVFAAGDNALGGVYSNIFRIITIILVIVLTIKYKGRNGESLTINRKNIFWKNS
ncbi:lysostaphin resistance A-like protein [Fulvivirgaceae bacterium LMO-SS25]